MLFQWLLFLLGLHVWAHGIENEITKAMRQHEVIPDIIDEGAEEMLQITYDNGVTVNKGEELTPTQVQNEPTRIEWKADPNGYYTLLMTEPDAPSRNVYSLREWLHWLVVNIPGKDVAKGLVLFGYQGSGASKETGLHRYVFLVYKQANKINFNEAHVDSLSIEGRPKFSSRKFLEKYGLHHPVAVNFFQAQYDEYSDVILAKLGLN